MELHGQEELHVAAVGQFHGRDIALVRERRIPGIVRRQEHRDVEALKLLQARIHRIEHAERQKGTPGSRMPLPSSSRASPQGRC